MSVAADDASPRTYYYRDRLPVTDADVTDGSGSALTVNIPLPEGAPAVRYPVEVRLGDEVISRREVLFIPDAVSIQLMRPLTGSQ